MKGFYKMGNENLDPAVKDTCDRLRENSRRLQNGNKSDAGDLHRSVADIGFLLATFFEAQPVTKAQCERFHQLRQSRGLHWPAATTIITVVVAIVAIVIKALS